jgi:6-phosphogluconolactonase
MHPILRASTRALTLASVLAAGAAGAAGAHATTHRGTIRTSGHVYVDLNTTPQNLVAGYDRHPDGTLTPIPGSPFPVGGAGTGATIGSQGALQFADGGSLLLAVDAGSNEISALNVAADGSLSPAGAPVASGGSEPVSLAVAGHRVYVANQGAGDADYTGFHLSRTGVLTPLPGTTVPLPADADPGDVLINSTGTRLVGTRVGTSQIDSFTIGRGGVPRAATGSPFAAQGPGPFGSAFDPADPHRVFVSNAHGGENAGTVSAFQDGPGGRLTSIGTGPFNDLQTAPCWVAVDRAGTELFAVNTAVPSVSRYTITPAGALRLTGTAPFAGSSTSGLAPEDAALTPSAGTLWVLDAKGDALSAFHTGRGRFAASPRSQTALPAGATPVGIAVN